MNYLEIIKSSLSGQFATLIYLLCGYELDKVINHDISNLISLIIAGIINFVFQSKIFMNEKIVFTTLLIVKYIFVDAVLYTFNELMFIKFDDYENSTLIRIIIAALGFILISYPLRKYFVFKA